MNRQDILREATRKAIKNGWKGSPLIDNVKHYQKLATSKMLVDAVYGESWYELVLLYLPPHDFAKALWGEEKPINFCNDEDCKLEAWQQHLRQMVIAENPLEYLKDNM